MHVCLIRPSFPIRLPMIVVSAIATTWAAAACGQEAPAPWIKPESSVIKWSARYHVETGKNTGFVIVKAEIPRGNHIYSLTQKSPLTPSKFALTASKNIALAKKFQADKKPKVIERDPIFNARVEKHVGTVQFFAPIRVAPNADLKTVTPVITYSGQMCSDEGFCVPIQGQKIVANFAGYFQREAKSPIPGQSGK